MEQIVKDYSPKWTSMAIWSCWHGAKDNCGTGKWLLVNSATLLPIHVSYVVGIFFCKFVRIHLFSKFEFEKFQRPLQRKTNTLKLWNIFNKILGKTDF